MDVSSSLVWRFAGCLAAALTAVFWSCTALAADDSTAGGPSYVLPYAVVILCVGLGVLVVCHFSRRRERPDEDVEDDG